MEETEDTFINKIEIEKEFLFLFSMEKNLDNDYTEGDN